MKNVWKRELKYFNSLFLGLTLEFYLSTLYHIRYAIISLSGLISE